FGLRRRTAVGGPAGGGRSGLGLDAGVLRQGLGGGVTVGQGLGELLGFLRRHLADDRRKRALLHLGGDRQADAVFKDRHAGRGVLGLHALEHLDQAIDFGGLASIGLCQQRLDVGLQAGQHLGLGVQLGLGGGEQGELGRKVGLALVELA